MSAAKFDPAVYATLRDDGLNNTQIADRLGISEASVRRGLRTIQHRPYLIPGYAMQALDVALEVPIRLNVEIDGPGAITADWHHPLTNYELVNGFIDHARDIGATNWLIVAGDWFNVDWLSAFDYKQLTAGAEAEMFGSSVTMERLLETFDRVYLSWGNHDARVHKTLGYKVPFSVAMKMMFHDLDSGLMSRITLSNLDYQVIDSPRGPYRVVHPRAYSSVPLTTARRLASKELQHIITGHAHHTALGHDPSGEFVVAEIGGFFDATKTEYLQRSTTYPKWQNGYGFIDAEGYLIVEGKGWSSRVGSRL